MTRTFKKAIDIGIVYEFVKRLSTPFKDTEAFKLGLIDEHGNFLKPRESYSDAELGAVTWFDILIINLKKLINKLPGGDSRIKNFAIALWLLKEEVSNVHEAICLSESKVNDALDEAQEVLIMPPKDYKTFMEDFAMSGGGDAAQSNSVSNVGAPAIGPFVKKKAQKKWKAANYNGMRAYYVPEDVFTKAAAGKTDRERFSAFISEPDMLEDMRGYARKYSDQPILLHNEKTGSYHFLKYGKRFKHLRQR